MANSSNFERNTTMNETGFEYLVEENFATIWSSERKWINKINKLKQSYPDEVQIKHTPEDNHGMIYARVPKNWFKLTPPRKVNLTEEQRAALSERMKNIQKGAK